MDGVEMVLGIVLMVMGVSLIIAAAIRTVRRGGASGAYEMFALPAVGAALILLGRWMLE